jgi:hypothetical protein
MTKCLGGRRVSDKADLQAVSGAVRNVNAFFLLGARRTGIRSVHVEMRLTPRSLWPLMDSPVARDCRARLFLRLLSVNPAPMEEIVQADLQHAQRQVH